MVRLLMVFAWIGLAFGVAAAVVFILVGPWTRLALFSVTAYFLGGMFWFALCSVLAETLTTVRSLYRRLQVLEREVSKPQA